MDRFDSTDDTTLIMEVLLDLRSKVDGIIDLLEDEDEEEEDA